MCPEFVLNVLTLHRTFCKASYLRDRFIKQIDQNRTNTAFSDMWAYVACWLLLVGVLHPGAPLLVM